MGTSPIAKVALGIWMLLPLTTRAETVLAVFTDREAFEKRLGVGLHVIGFDDVQTEDGTPVGFKPDRYVNATGAVIIGQAEKGQFVSRSFGHVNDYVPSSAPNMYAPAPRPRKAREAQVTSVAFSVERREGVVAGFGAVSIDADYPRLGPSCLEALDSDGKLLGTTGTIAGRNASQLFRGIIAVDVDSGKPVPVVAEVRLVTGDQWPALDVSEGVVLDDFVFSRPEPRPRTKPQTGAVHSSRIVTEKEVIELTAQAVAQNDTWADRATYKAKQEDDGTWSVMVRRITGYDVNGKPEFTSGGHRLVLVNATGKVTKYIRGR